LLEKNYAKGKNRKRFITENAFNLLLAGKKNIKAMVAHSRSADDTRITRLVHVAGCHYLFDRKQAIENIVPDRIAG
jgi:hypothetical protein